MRYKNTPYLNDYEAETRRWHIKRTEQLNEDYQYYRNERKRWIVNEESLEALRHQFKMDGEAENKNTCAFDDRLEAIENGIPEWTAISNLTDRLEALEHIHKLENIADESPPVSFDRTDEKGYWWCPIHGKVTREHNCEGFYHDVPVNEFGVTEPCWEELEHRTDEKEFNMADHRHFIDGGDSTDEHTSTPIVLGHTTEHRTDEKVMCDVCKREMLRHQNDKNYVCPNCGCLKPIDPPDEPKDELRCERIEKIEALFTDKKWALAKRCESGELIDDLRFVLDEFKYERQRANRWKMDYVKEARNHNPEEKTDEQKDELRCIDCGEKARAVNTRNGFCYVCEHNNHTTTAFYPTKASAKAAYRKLIDDRAIADRARAEDRRLNEDCTDYLTGWLDCASRIVYGGEGS